MSKGLASTVISEGQVLPIGQRSNKKVNEVIDDRGSDLSENDQDFSLLDGINSDSINFAMSPDL